MCYNVTGVMIMAAVHDWRGSLAIAISFGFGDPIRSKNTALGVFRTPGGVLGTCFAL